METRERGERQPGASRRLLRRFYSAAVRLTVRRPDSQTPPSLFIGKWREFLTSR